MSSQPPLLEIAEFYLRSEIAPQAAAIDRDQAVLRWAMQGLGDRSLLALKITASEEEFRRFQEMVARYSGALAFLQIQHQSASSAIFASENQPLKQAYLPGLATGDRMMGIGFSHLRRPGEPLVKAFPVKGGYRISGELRWATGFNIFPELILAATLADGRAVFAIIPFANATQTNGGELHFSEPMQLAAMQSTNTVSGEIKNWFVPHDYIVSIQPPGWIHQNDRQKVLMFSFFCLGCARAALDIIERTAKIKQLPIIQETFEVLERKLTKCREAIWQQLPVEGIYENGLKLRAEAIALANRCAHAAVTVASGEANYLHHPAQRVYREALLFTVFGQTTDVMTATLHRLIGDG